MIPIFLWNLFLTSYLPNGYSMDVFWKDIPPLIGNTENILRIIVFMLPLVMTFSLKSRQQKIGFVVFLAGLILYFSSWLMQIYLPESNWSNSIFGFMAPAYTTLIWFVGIGLIGNTSVLKIPFISHIYIGSSLAFVIVHSIHTYIVYMRF